MLKGGDSRITLVADATDEVIVESSVRRGLVDPPAVATCRATSSCSTVAAPRCSTSFCSVDAHRARAPAPQPAGGIEDGSLTARGLIGSVRVSVADGRVDLADMDADTVDLSIGDGSARLRLVNAPQSVSVRTGDGRGSVCIPSTSPSYAVTVHKADGSVRVDVASDARSSRPMTLTTGDGSVAAGFCT